MIASQDARLLLGEPLLNPEIGTLGAHPMLAGIIPSTVEMAVRAGLGVSAQNGGAADHEGMSRLADEIRQQMHLLKSGISDQKYRLNSGSNHSSGYVNYGNININILFTRNLH